MVIVCLMSVVSADLYELEPYEASIFGPTCQDGDSALLLFKNLFHSKS